MANYPYLEWLNESMGYMEYPENSIESVVSAYKKICDNKRADRLFSDALNLYEKRLIPDWSWVLSAAERAGNAVDLHKFVAHFVFTLCATKHIKAFYAQKGMPEGCFEGFLKDIKSKWSECVKVHKMDGVFVAEWFNRFADGTRHTFGRLQFEPIFLGADYEGNGIAVKEGDMVINIHIPGGSKLLKQDCIDAFLKAAEYYSDLFEDKRVIFHCNSWLLYPDHKDFLPETSSLLMFADFFNIVEIKEWKGDLWRIFNRTDCEENLADLPEDTSLQRAFKKRLLEGGEIGSGRGFFAVKDGKFIK